MLKITCPRCESDDVKTQQTQTRDGIVLEYVCGCGEVGPLESWRDWRFR